MSNELFYKARTAMDAGRLETAIHIFLQSAQEEPHFKTYELLGECLMKLERFSDAVVYLAAATALNQGVRAPSLLAQAFFKLGMHYDSKNAAEIALSRDPTNRLAKMVLQAISSDKI